MNHSFDVNVAVEYGVHSAIILQNIGFWIQKNAANGENFNDGDYWTYNSKKAFAELFPYMTERQIDYALSKLIEAGVLKTGNYNKSAYDRTLWYALTDYGKSILQFCEMEKTKPGNGSPEIVPPIPDSKPVKNSVEKPNSKRFTPPTVDEVKAYCLERKNNVDPERFVDYYTSNGWVVGKNKMKDWKAAVRTWERNGYSQPQKTYGANGIAIENKPSELDGIL